MIKVTDDFDALRLLCTRVVEPSAGEHKPPDYRPWSTDESFFRLSSRRGVFFQTTFMGIS